MRACIVRTDVDNFKKINDAGLLWDMPEMKCSGSPWQHCTSAIHVPGLISWVVPVAMSSHGVGAFEGYPRCRDQ